MREAIPCRAYVYNVGWIGSFPSMKKAKDAAKETVRNGGRAAGERWYVEDEHGELVAEGGGR